MTFTNVQNGSAITGSTSGGVTTLALTLPVASTAGTLLVACMEVGAAGTPAKISTVTTTAGSNPNTSPGWEWCCTSVNGSGNGGQQVEIWCYRANPGGITSTTWANAAGQGARGHLMEFSTTSAWQVMELFPGLNTAVTAGATSFPVSMGNPVGANELAISLFGDNFSTGTVNTWTTPPGWTAGRNTSGQSISAHWASYYMTTSGAGTVSVTGVTSTSTNQVGWEAAVVVFREAAAVASRVGASCSKGSYTDQASFGFPSTKTGSAKEFDLFVGRPMSQTAQVSYQTPEGNHLTGPPVANGTGSDLVELFAMGAQICWSLKPYRTGSTGFTTVAAEQAAVDQDLTYVKQAGITGFYCCLYNEYNLGGANGPFGNDTYKPSGDPYGTGNTDATAKNNFRTYWQHYQPTLAAHGIPAYASPSYGSPVSVSSWLPPAGTISGVAAHFYYSDSAGKTVYLDQSAGTDPATGNPAPALQDICDGIKNPDGTTASNTPIPLGIGETGRSGGSSTPAWSLVVAWSHNGTSGHLRDLFKNRLNAGKQNAPIMWFENNIGGPNWIHTPGVNGEDQTGIQAELAAWVDNLTAAPAPVPVVVTTSSLPNGALGVAYSQTLTASGGTPPYTWTVATGSLPTGLSLSSAGVISGTPSAGGTFTFTVTATDTLSSAGTSGTLAIFVPALSITTTSLNPATFGGAYSQTLTETGGTGPFTWSLTSGLLPDGLSLSTGGVLSGTDAGPVGTYPVTITVTDSAGNTASVLYSLSVTAGGGPGGPPATPPGGWPQLIVEAGFYAAAPVAPPGTLILDDTVNGVLGTGMLGDATAWTDITTFVRGGTITRASTRVQGPLRTYQAGTVSLTLANGDARFDPDNTTGPYVTGGVSSVRPMVPLRIRAIYSGTEYHLFNGFADSWVTPDTNWGPQYAETTVSATDGFKILAGVTIPAAAATGAGNLSGTRIDNILDNAGWYTDHRKTQDGNATVQATTFGDTALNLLQLTTDSEVGELYIDGSGNVVFRQRRAAISDTRSTTPQATFSDDGTQLPYLAVGRADDDTTLANDVQITIAGSSNMQEAQNAKSITKYLFPRSYARSDIILQSDAQALLYAQWVLFVSLAGEDRFDTLTVSPQRDPRVWPQVLGREIGDRITVTRNPPGMGTITKDVFVRGITHTFDASSNTWQTAWDLDDASRYTGYVILDDTTFGKLSSGNKVAF